MIGPTAGTYTATVAAGETPSIGNLTISSTATVVVDGTLTGAAASTFSVKSGALSALNGGTVVVGTGGLALAGSSASSATVTVSGTHSDLRDSGGINVGVCGAGLLQVMNSGTIELTGANGITTGVSSAAATGTVSVSGTGSVLQLDSTAGGFTIGNTGQGTIEALNGGSIAMNGTGGIIVGSAAGSDLLEVSGTGAVLDQSTNGARIAVGGASGGSGTLEVLAGGTMVLDGTKAASDTLTGFVVGKLGAGTVLVDGIGSSLTLGNGATIGYGANGTMTVQNHGSVTNTGTSSFLVGFGANDSGTLIVDDAALTNTNGNFIVGGTNSAGTLQVQHGGMLNTGNGTTALSSINAVGIAIASATVNGGTWTVNGTVLVGQNGSGLLDIKTDGTSSGVVNAGTGGIVIASQSGGSGTATIENGGTLNGGQLLVADTSSATGLLSLASGGIVTVNGGTVGSGGTISVTGGLLDSIAALTIAAGGTIAGVGTLEASFNNGGLISATGGGTLQTTGSIAGAGTLEIDSNSTLAVDGSAPTAATVSFTNAGTAETFILGTPGSSFSSTISGFAGTDRIEFNFGAGTIASAVASGNTITVTTTGGGPSTYLLNNVTFAAGSPTVLNYGSDSATGDQYIQVLCFLRGTQIATPNGAIEVQRLAVGDTVSTMDGKAERIVWIGTGRALVTPGRRSPATPVVVRKGALADNVPYRDLRVTKGHSLFIDDVLIPVEYLVNHRSILWDDRAREVEIFHIELARHSVLIADGAPAESYRDDGNRWLFQNYNEGWGLAPQEPCAPVLTGGPIVDSIWSRLLERAGPRRLPPMTDDPDLHLIVDGEWIDVSRSVGSDRVFYIPWQPRDVRIVSRDVVPAELGLARDPRSLGVALRQIEVRRGVTSATIAVDDPRLREGFHDYEPAEALRWTNGNAALPAALFALRGYGAIRLVLTLGGVARYPEQTVTLAA